MGLSLFLMSGLAFGQAGASDSIASSSPERRLTVVSGPPQELALGRPGSYRVMVEVMDRAGRPVPGVDVGFTFPSSGPARGIANTGARFTIQKTDGRGRAVQPVKPDGEAGEWTLVATAAGAPRTAINLLNVAQTNSQGAGQAPAGTAPHGTATPPKSGLSVNRAAPSHTLVYVLVGIGGAAVVGGALAAKGGSKNSGSNNTVNTGGGTTPSAVTITLGSGSFGTPGHH